MRKFLALLLVAFASLPATGQPVAPPSSGPQSITVTNKSGTITVGGATNQIAIAANPKRATCHVQPQTSDVYINVAAGATTLDSHSEFLPVMSEYSCPTGYKGDVGIAGIVTGATFYADEGTTP